MQIIVDLNDELRSNNSVNIELTSMFIFWENEGEYYPDDEWIDNPAIILGWWSYSLVDLLKGGEGQGLSFMEGPFCCDLKLEGDRLKIRSEDGVISWDVDKKEFATALVSALKKASRLFYEMGHPGMTNGFNDGIKLIKEHL